MSGKIHTEWEKTNKMGNEELKKWIKLEFDVNIVNELKLMNEWMKENYFDYQNEMMYVY